MRRSYGPIGLCINSRSLLERSFAAGQPTPRYGIAAGLDNRQRRHEPDARAVLVFPVWPNRRRVAARDLHRSLAPSISSQSTQEPRVIDI